MRHQPLAYMEPLRPLQEEHEFTLRCRQCPSDDPKGAILAERVNLVRVSEIGERHEREHAA